MFKRLATTTCFTLAAIYISTSFASTMQKEQPVNAISDDDYRIVVFENCEKVLEQPLNNAQVSSFLALEEQSKLMKQLEAPVQKVSAQMGKLGHQIEAISDKAFVKHGDKLTIDKALLAEQKSVSQQLEALADAHSDDFKALEKQGKHVESAAKHFESQIKPMIGSLENAQIQILEPGELAKPCSTYITRS
ncbi:hypothetical protein PA25_35770 [Pseudoalteromonas sp. A25]|uniref:hypothetical protein n=1 Tax=Pseudoalteromonas sp. A25 TaxID=116092 RepID=UPI0012605E41|nr:hypothetical protein [Pseudoalteromonas sp. A25]BBN83592.1 hypothetical protein PA25_35770 [Pseudoalteromonas sp. A25]